MDRNYQACLKKILAHEGGNDDDPQDPGGRTSRGIIQREYNAYRKGKGQPPRDVWKASDDEVREIYRKQYWEPSCPKLKSGLDLLYFDMAVNTGPAQAAKLFQRALGLQADGHFGVVSLEAANNFPQTSRLIHLIGDRRRAYYKSLHHFARFGRGWLRRVDETETMALSLVEDDDDEEVPTKVRASAGKAMPDQIDDKVHTVVAEVRPSTAGTAAAGLGSASAIVQQAQEQLAPLSDTLTYVKYALLLCALVGLVIAVYGIIKRNKARAAVN